MWTLARHASSTASNYGSNRDIEVILRVFFVVDTCAASIRRGSREAECKPYKQRDFAQRTRQHREILPECGFPRRRPYPWPASRAAYYPSARMGYTLMQMRDHLSLSKSGLRYLTYMKPQSLSCRYEIHLPACTPGLTQVHLVYRQGWTQVNSPVLI